MLLEVRKEAAVDAPRETVWTLLRDFPRLGGCIPKVTDLQEVEADQRYTAVVSDKLGPFGLQVPVEITIQSIEAPRRIVAQITGNDSRGAARVKGTLEAVTDPEGAGSHLTFNIRMEVLGRLATLGAAPMRRRAEEIFSEFVRRVQAELASGRVA